MSKLPNDGFREKEKVEDLIVAAPQEVIPVVSDARLDIVPSDADKQIYEVNSATVISDGVASQFWKNWSGLKIAVAVIFCSIFSLLIVKFVNLPISISPSLIMIGVAALIAAILMVYAKVSHTTFLKKQGIPSAFPPAVKFLIHLLLWTVTISLIYLILWLPTKH